MPARESVSVSGNLAVTRGGISVESGGITYLTFGLNSLVGFVDGLKEGAQVALEGYAAQIPKNEKEKIMHVTKMTLNGKEYDLGRKLEGSPPNRSSPMGQDRR